MYDKLSNKQRVVLEKKGKFVIRACPGSGKTYCVSARLASYLSQWKPAYQGVATLSFTNTAWQEIEKKCLDDFKTSVSFPHFLGTIDSFINQYIFLPFGHLVLNCGKRPILVGEPFGTWFSGSDDGNYNRYFDAVSYDANGDLCDKSIAPYFFGSFPDKYNRDGITINGHYAKLLKMKGSLNRLGFATQSDANYFALEILKLYPCLAKSIALRFPVFVVDEAQDTTEIQMEIINLLIRAGLDEIMMVGDPDQAIFEWNSAKPNLFLDKEKEWEENSIILDESWRSSQNICNAVYNLSSLGSNKIIAVNKQAKDCKVLPEIWVYEDNSNSKNRIVNRFKEKCIECGITMTPRNVAILSRSKSFFNQSISLSGIPWVNDSPYTKDFALGKFLYIRKDIPKAIKQIEKGYIKATKKLSYFSEKEAELYKNSIGIGVYRNQTYGLVELLPDIKADTKIGDWINYSNQALLANGYDFPLKIDQSFKDALFSQIFPSEHFDNAKLDFRLSTIHKVKGETFEATLLFLKKKVKKNYTTMLANNDVTNEEELRNVYVAISRPSKLLVIAVPDEENKKCWADKLKI